MPDSSSMVLVYNKREWLVYGNVFGITETEINNADEKGFIGTFYGVDCYLTRPVGVICSS